MLQFLKHPFFRHPIIVIAIGIAILWFISLSLPILLAYVTALLLEPVIIRISSEKNAK